MSSFPFPHGTSLPLSLQASHQPIRKCHHLSRDLSLQTLVWPSTPSGPPDGSVRDGIEGGGAGASLMITSSISGMLLQAPILAPSRQKRPPSKMPSNSRPPFNHGPPLSSSATANYCLRPSATLTQLTRLSSNCRLQWH